MKMEFTQKLLCALFCMIIASVVKVDGKRVVSDIPGDILDFISADIPKEEFSTELPRAFPTEFPREFPKESTREFPREFPKESPRAPPSEFPREFPVEAPSDIASAPEEGIVRGNSRTPNGGCPMNLCFALDGSRSISSSEYLRQRFLARLIAESLPENEPFGLAAVQYNVASTPISPLTLDRNLFISRIRASQQEGDIGTFLVAGINYCFSELDEPNMTAPLCGINKIIVMGDGRGNIGTDAVERAREFERRGGEICTVAFGSPDIRALTAIAGDASRVFGTGNLISIRQIAQSILARTLGPVTVSI